MVDDEKVIEKIRRLFALSKSSNIYEAAAAAEKAQELLHKYGLEQGDITDKGEDARFERRLIRLKDTAGWNQQLMNVLAIGNGAKLISLAGKGEVALIGRGYVLEVVEYSYQQLNKRISWLADVAWDIYEGLDRESSYKKSFCDGAVHALWTVLKAKTQAWGTGSGAELVVVEGKLLDQAVAGWYPFLSTGRNYGRVQGEGYGAGVRAGGHLSVNAGLGTKPGQTRRLS